MFVLNYNAILIKMFCNLNLTEVKEIAEHILQNLEVNCCLPTKGDI